jgi:hypothetical protein
MLMKRVNCTKNMKSSWHVKLLQIAAFLKMVQQSVGWRSNHVNVDAQAKAMTGHKQQDDTKKDPG